VLCSVGPVRDQKNIENSRIDEADDNLTITQVKPANTGEGSQPEFRSFIEVYGPDERC
jgi:hypothetical protein